MTKKHSILTAALASVLTLLFTIAEPVSVLGAGSSSAGTTAAASITAGTSHAEAVYKASLPLLLSPNKLPEAISYLNANMYAVGSYRAAIMTLRLENAQKAALPAWEDKFYNSVVQRKLTDIYEPGDRFAQLADKTKNVNLRLMLRRAAACGYKLETAEGSFFPVIDYDAYRNTSRMSQVTYATIFPLWQSNRISRPTRIMVLSLPGPRWYPERWLRKPSLPIIPGPTVWGP